MKWFAVNCIYQIVCSGGSHAGQFDEQLRLILAKDKAEALFKILSLENNQRKVLEKDTGSVTWIFLGISNIMQVEEPGDGVVAYSRIMEPASPEKYLEDIQQRNNFLMEFN